MTLSQAFNFWEDYLTDWDNDPAAKAKKDPFFANGSKTLNTGIKYLPEPYYGNSGAIDSPISCVIIDLNPGLSSPFDKFKLHQKGAFLYDYFHSSGYSRFNAKYSPFHPSSQKTIGTPFEIPGAAWWRDKRMKWIDKFLRRYGNVHWPFKIIADPLVMELCPWHSKEWNTNIIKGMGSFLMDVVFEPAAEGIKKSNLPFGLCFGKDAGQVLLNNGFTIVKEWSHYNPVGKWPVNKEGKLVNRTYRLLVDEKGKIFFLNIYASGTFSSPGSSFMKDVEPVIIADLQTIFS